MAGILIIGAGGVSGVAVHKCAQAADVFTDICLASRTKSKCDALAAQVKEKYNRTISTAQVDADNVPHLVELIKKVRPDVVLNLALPYQDLTIMDACLATKTDYLDTANYEPEDTAKFEYKWQWDYKERFENAVQIVSDANLRYSVNRSLRWCDFGFPVNNRMYDFDKVREHMLSCGPIFHGLNDGKYYYCHVSWSADKAKLLKTVPDDYVVSCL